MRGFQIAKGFNDVELPVRGTKFSAGYDLKIIEDLDILPGKVALGKTGLKAYMGEDEVLKIYPRSSLAVKKHLNLANNVGIIDKDYYGNENNDGHIMIPLFNFGDEAIHLKAGERVAQGIFEKYLIAESDQADNERRGGFGSTGN